MLLSQTNSPLTLSFEFSKPIIGIYDTIDNNPKVRQKMIDYYFDLIRDKWLLDELNDILNYFIYNNGEISLTDYNKNNIYNDTDQIAEKKVEYIEKHIFSIANLTKLLKKFIKETNTKWVMLPKHESLLRYVVKKYLVKLITKKLKHNNKIKNNNKNNT